MNYGPKTCWGYKIGICSLGAIHIVIRVVALFFPCLVGIFLVGWAFSGLMYVVRIRAGSGTQNMRTRLLDKIAVSCKRIFDFFHQLDTTKEPA